MSANAQAETVPADKHAGAVAKPVATSEATQQFLTFTLSEEEYGVDIMMVREVKGWTDTTRLPNSPEDVRGVLNLRGIIIPIFDLRARFTGKLTEPESKHVIIVLAVDTSIVGILVDTVSDILTVSTDDIKPVPEADTRDDKHYVHGLIAVEKRMVVLLNIAKLLGRDAEIAKQHESQPTNA